MKCRRALATWLVAALASSGLWVAGTAVQAAAAGVVGVSTGPGQVLGASLAAAKGEDGVDWVGTSHGANVAVTLTTKAGRRDGVQSINFRLGAKNGQVSIILVETTVYINGNAFGLQQYLGFSAGAAEREAGHWLSIEEPDASLVNVYEAVAAGLTVSTTVSELAMTGPLTETAARELAGQRVIGIRGTTLVNSQAPPTPQLLYVRSTGEHLPVQAVQSYKGQASSETLGPWGHAPAVHVPTGAVPLQIGWLTSR
jgi:hypothetical protein